MDNSSKYIPVSCPFCGEDCEHLTFRRYENGRVAVECEFCESVGPVSETDDQAVLKWNRRVK